jgi:hypothetical protein
MLLHAAPPPAAAHDPVGSYLLAAIFLLGGALNLLAAVIGMFRKGDLQSWRGRQAQALFGKRGAIAFWFVLGTGCVAAGVWFLVRAS